MPRTLALAAVLALVAAPVYAGPKRDAKKHVDRAMKHHKAGEFEAALRELEAAYKLDPKPDLLYAIGQVHVKLDRCGDAIAFYEKFLATKPAAGPSSLARQAIASCQAKVEATTPEPAPEPPPPAPAPAPEPAPVATPEPTPLPAPPLETRREVRRAPWYRDRLGLALGAAGVICGVGGAVLYANARGDIDAAETAGTYGRGEELREAGRGKRTVAAIVGGAGAVLLGAGLVHIMIVDRPEERAVGVAWSGRF